MQFLSLFELFPCREVWELLYGYPEFLCTKEGMLRLLGQKQSRKAHFYLCLMNVWVGESVILECFLPSLPVVL